MEQVNKGDIMSKKSDELESLPIKMIRVYQAVNFNKKVETYFTTSEVGPKPPVEVNIIKDLLSVEVKNDQDHILIPLTNVSVIVFDAPVHQKREDQIIEEKQKTSSVRASDIKRPK